MPSIITTKQRLRRIFRSYRGKPFDHALFGELMSSVGYGKQLTVTDVQRQPTGEVSITLDCEIKEQPKGTPIKDPCDCCDRQNEYNGFGSDGPLLFVCPKHCPCHD